MKNMGLADLVLVAATAPDMRAAAPMAVHARDVLAAHRRVATLADAIHDCGLVVGTSGRVGGDFQGESPRALAPAMVAASAANDVALVFGPEDHGLSNEDLKLCHELVTIPTHSSYASMNLAQAVGICCYELFLARHAGRAPSPTLATSDRLERLYDQFGRALLRIGFLHGANPEHIMFTLRRIFGRAHLDAREVAIWTGIARQIEWFAEGGREVAEEKRRKGLRLK